MKVTTIHNAGSDVLNDSASGLMHFPEYSGLDNNPDVKAHIPTNSGEKRVGCGAGQPAHMIFGHTINHYFPWMCSIFYLTH